MTIQQICGALDAFSLSFCNTYLRIMKHLIENSSKKDICFKAVHAFHCHPVQQKKERKTSKNKMLLEALIR
jgi:hypothetical protein